jgi:hypothetical protein
MGPVRSLHLPTVHGIRGFIHHGGREYSTELVQTLQRKRFKANPFRMAQLGTVGRQSFMARPPSIQYYLFLRLLPLYPGLGGHVLYVTGANKENEMRNVDWF